MFDVRRQTCALAIALLFLGMSASGMPQTPPPPAADGGEPAQPQTVPADQKPAEEPQEGEAVFADEITVIEEPSLTMASPAARTQELAEIPGGATLIDAEEFELGRAATLKDALDFTPGVFVQPRFGSEESRLSIRGSGLQRTFHGRGLKLLQDGVPLNLADGSFDFQAVEPLAARYIEVLRGSNALGVGSSTLGGAINYVSLNGYEANPAQVRFEGGSFGYLRGRAGVAGSSGRSDYVVNLSHSSQDGFREHAEQSSQRLFANFGVRTSPDRETRFFVTGVRTASELPGNLTLAQLEDDPSQAAAGNVALDQRRDFNLFRLANRTSFRFGDQRRLDVGAYWSYKDLDHPIFQVLDQVSHDLGADVRYESESTLAGRPNHFVLGVSPSFGRLQDSRFRNVGGSRGARTAQGETESLNLDVYMEDRWQLSSRLALIGGAQASYAGRDFTDGFLQDGDQTDSQSFRGLNPKIGFFYDLTTEISLFGNFGRSFEAPSFGELVNVGGDGLVQLDAQTANSVEVGSRGSAGLATWDIVVYHAQIQGELLSLNDAIGNPLGTRNADRTIHRGVEAGLELRIPVPVGNLALRQVYTLSDFRFDGDRIYGDNRLAGMPEHFYRMDLLWEGTSGLYGGPNLEWVPEEYPVDHANTLFAHPYTVLGLKLGWRSSQGWGGFIEGKNLTDEVYAATTGVIADARGRDSAQFLPGDGISIFTGIEYRW